VSGDYKADPDPTCRAFEPLRCDTFVTESTFGLPIYRWPPQSEVFDEINRWWRGNREEGRASLLFAYALGKAQRILAGVDASIGPIYCHGAVDQVCRAYRAAGVELPAYEYAGRGEAKSNWAGALVLAPPSALGTPWMRKFGDAATAFASGWMLIRGARRRRSVDRGFVLSDHADWPALLQAIRDTEAERVLVTHGHVSPLVGWLREQGIPSEPLATRYEGERDDADLDDGSPEDLAAEAET
jgi:putative mRNA 3-end processing factor